jgi:TM2 domain-containing membrane protein YozV
MSNQGTAAVLSAVLPGLGQIYNGRILWAIFWFIVTPGLWIGSGGLLGWVCHILAAWQAYSYGGRADPAEGH